jgi:pseudoazurin
MNIRNALCLCLSGALAASTASDAGTAPRHHVINVMTDYAGGGMYFEPQVLHVAPGDTVTWVNRVDEEHSIITFPDGYPQGAEGFESPLLAAAGQAWSYSFAREGTYEYHCLPHLPMGMQGAVIVGRPSRDEEFHAPDVAEIDSYRRKMMEWFGDEAAFLPRHQRH